MRFVDTSVLIYASSPFPDARRGIDEPSDLHGAWLLSRTAEGDACGANHAGRTTASEIVGPAESEIVGQQHEPVPLCHAA